MFSFFFVQFATSSFSTVALSSIAQKKMGEPEVPTALRHLRLSFDALTATQRLASMRNPHKPPTLLFQARNLCLASQHPISKVLSPSDVHSNRAHRDALLIPRNDVEENIKPSLNANENPGDGISIRVYDAYRGDYGLSFVKYADGKYYIIHGPEDDDRWSDFVREDMMEVSQSVSSLCPSH